MCPFNSYHKQFDRRKFLFHIARCKDRRGKTVYSCQYSSEHIFISIDKLIEHEKTECPKRPIKIETTQEEIQLEDEDLGEKDLDLAGVSKRQPAVCYCQYNVEHAFKTL